jgi:HAMP domain-containing protein
MALHQAFTFVLSGPKPLIRTFVLSGPKPLIRTLEYKLGPTFKWGALSPLTERPWVVSVAIPEARILDPIHRALTRTLLVGLAITFGVFLLALALGSSFLRPVHELSNAMARFGAGEVSVRAPILVRDERGRLAQDFNAMANALQVHQQQLEGLVKARTQDLETTLAEVKTLRGMIPICGYCKKIRDEEGGWWQMERYIHDHSEAAFSHGICPDCRKKEFPDVKERGQQT